ncbi:hypothetical protein ACHAW6_006206 [Cyclotella cf. meneghiniana]
MMLSQVANTSASALLLMLQLHTPALQTHILPALSSNLLLSIGTFADNGYVTIFHEGNRGTTIHDHNDITITSTKPAILQGCRDKNRLWHVQLAEPTSIPHHVVGHCTNNIYDLLSTAHLVQCLHAALGFPTRNTLLTAICNGNLTTFCKLKTTIRSNGCTVELTPPDVHQHNNAKCTIQTFKSHFIAILSGVDNSFPITEWDSLLPQAILIVNLLYNANVAPKISAYTYHHGPFDYDRMPLASIGCAVQFHVKPGHRRTWGEHSTDRWYIGASPEHYRTHHIFIKATRSHCLSDMVYFKHKYITQPTVAQADAIVKAFEDLMATLKGTTNLKGQQNLEALTKLQSMLSPPATPLPHFRRVNFHNTVQLCTSTPTV